MIRRFSSRTEALLQKTLPLLDSEGAYAASDLGLFGGYTTKAFSETCKAALSQPIPPKDIEIRPDGLLFLPEIKYRRILNESFGNGNWKLIPRSPHFHCALGNGYLLMRDYALICDSIFVSQARGEQEFYQMKQLGGAVEAVKSNALTRCCKDLGIASELWDPTFVKEFKAKHFQFKTKLGKSTWEKI